MAVPIMPLGWEATRNRGLKPEAASFCRSGGSRLPWSRVGQGAGEGGGDLARPLQMPRAWIHSSFPASRRSSIR